MNRRHRKNALISGLALALAGVAAAPLSWGCADEAGDIPGNIDAGVGVDLDAAPPDDRRDGGPAGALAENRDDLGVGCYDFVDTDGDGLRDCEDDECSTAPICCVGSSSDGCCTDTATGGVELDCDGSGTAALAACATGASIFGSPSPELRDRTMVPLGGDRFDSGLVLAGAVDPRVARLTLEGVIAAGESCAACIDAVAFGLTTAEGALGATTLVDPDVALMVSTSQGEIRLLVGGAVARAVALETVRASLGVAIGARIEYQLTTTPGGLASVRARDGASGESTNVFTDVPYAPDGPARVVIWGRSTNRAAGDPPPAAIASLEVITATCDAPASVARRTAPILPDEIDPWWPAGARVRGSSVVVYDDAGTQRSMMAFAYEGRIHLAGGIADGRFRALADPRVDTNAAVRAGAGDWLAGGVADPELVRGENRWEIWFTAIDAAGARSIGRALGEPGFALQFPTAEVVLSPEPAAGTDGWDAPSYLETTVRGTDHRYLAARRTSGTMTEIVIHEIDASDDSLSPAAATRFDSDAGEAVNGDVVHRATLAPTAFDANEVASPALVQYGGVLRLYYAGRRGTRWAIGVLVSEDGNHWRSGNDGEPVLGGSGSGFDALSVSDPEPVRIDGELRLYYAGSDGVGSAIGLGSHSIPGTP